jgi:hypothetical protein
MAAFMPAPGAGEFRGDGVERRDHAANAKATDDSSGG